MQFIYLSKFRSSVKASVLASNLIVFDEMSRAFECTDHVPLSALTLSQSGANGFLETAHFFDCV